MARPRLLDLFCGAGGAAMGYHRAGFEVVGVDYKPQPHYPFAFVQGDALVPPVNLAGFQAIHASPPCQAFTQMSAKHRGRGGIADSHPNLIPQTRDFLEASGLPWVLENVVGARRELLPMIVLHGGMFGLGVHRPRLFEANVLLLTPLSRSCKQPIGVYGDHPDGHTTHWRNNGSGGGRSIVRTAKSLEEAQIAMGMDWADWHGTKEAIPPAYTELIGSQLINYCT